MKPYKLHLYPQIPCPFPHQSFTGDLQYLYSVHDDDEALNRFINQHSIEYLAEVIRCHPPLLQNYLSHDHYHHRGKYEYSRTFKRYFRELDERKQTRANLDLIPNSPSTDKEQ